MTGLVLSEHTGIINAASDFGASPAARPDANRAALEAAFTAAAAQGYAVHLPAGTYRVDNDGGLRWRAGIAELYGAHKGTTLVMTSNAHHGLHVGPGAGGNDLGPAGVIRQLRITGPGGVPPKNAKAGLLLDGWRFGEVRDVSVDGFDVGFDLVGNCYGTAFHRPMSRYNTCNIGLRLRTGLQNGDDLPFYNPWLSGRTAAVWIESDPADGTAGFYFHGGQYASNIVGDTIDHDDLGAVTIGKNYETGATVGEPRQIIFWGGLFEAVGRRWMVKVHTPSTVQFRGTRFNLNGSGGTGGDSTLGVLSHARPYDDCLIFDGVHVTGTYRRKLIDYTPDVGANPQLLELVSHGKPVYHPAGGTAVSHNLFEAGLFERSGLSSRGVVIRGGRAGRVAVDGRKLA